MGHGEIMTIVGQNWKNLTPADKKPFELLHEADKARYLKEVELQGPVAKTLPARSKSPVRTYQVYSTLNVKDMKSKYPELSPR